MVRTILFVLVILTLSQFSFGVTFEWYFEENTQLHSTDKFRFPTDHDPTWNKPLILRRGNEFVFTVCTDTNIPKPFSKIVLNDLDPFTLETSSSNSSLEFNEDVDYTIEPSGTSNCFDIYVIIPEDFKIGYFSLGYTLDDVLVYSGMNIIVIFNPYLNNWSENTRGAMLNEYLFNEEGRVAVGSTGTGRHWVYKQFDFVVLEVTLKFIFKNVPWDSRGNIVIITRTLTWSFNSASDPTSALMHGKWGTIPKETDTQQPGYWVNSAEIFELYKKTSTPVKYVQCWVFASVLTSAGRALGIPSRSVTNIQSAHEKPPYPLHLNYMIDELPGPELESGSVWNFHVWNEFWFTRPDIVGGEGDGWQALDATPQEISDGTYQMGPAPIKAVAARKYNLKYDVRFVASEVDSALWIYSTNPLSGDTSTTKQFNGKTYYLVSIDTTTVGKQILTKRPASNSLDNLAEIYNPPLVKRATLVDVTNSSNDGVSLNIITPTEITIGDSVTLALQGTCDKCNADVKRFVSIVDTVELIDYSGVLIKSLQEVKSIVELSQTPLSQHIEILPEEYLPYFTSSYMSIRYNVFLSIYTDEQLTDATGQYAIKESQILISVPELHAEIIETTTESVTLTLLWEHEQIPLLLSNVLVRINGPYVEDHDETIGDIDLSSDTVWKSNEITLEIIGHHHEHIEIYIELVSDKLPNLSVELDVPLTENHELEPHDSPETGLVVGIVMGIIGLFLIVGVVIAFIISKKKVRMPNVPINDPLMGEERV